MALDQLKLSTNPFASSISRAHVAPPLRRALDDVWRQIRRKTKAIVVVGSAGTGKSLLLDLLEGAAGQKGMSVHRIERGDLAEEAIGSWSDLLLIDEADTLSAAALESLLSNPETTPARCIILACRKPLGALPSTVRSATVTVPLLTLVDARDYVSKRVSSAGRPDLFTPDALNALVAASGGSAQMLHLLGGIALFFAAYAGATRVQRHHVVEALAAQVGIITKRRDEAAVSPGATVKPAAAAARAGRRNALDNMRRKILVPFIAGRNLVGRSGLSERLLGRVSAILLLAVALPWWWLQSHPNALPPMAEIIKESERAGGLGEQQRSAADVLQGSALPKLGLADAEQQRQNGVHQGVLRELAMSISQIPAVSSLPELSTAPRAFAGTAPPASSLRPNAAEAGMDALAATAAGNRAESPSRQAAANVQPRPRPDRISGTTAAGQFVRDVVGSARTPAPTARKRRQSEQEAAPVETARISDPPSATLARSALASPVLTAATPSPSGAPARRPSRAASEQFTSAQDVRDDARETRETATFASAARDAAQTARLAREAAATATAVREAAATASAAREAAAAATAARDAAATASSAREAVVAATAAREAAATASAAIDAAAAATAAREAAATVNAAREAAAAATAARDAAATASAAREAASVASAAKDAVVVAQAAKETVDQVNAARQAAEVAKDAQATVAAAKAAVGL